MLLVVMAHLTNTDQRILQTFLHLRGPVPSDTLMMVIRNGRAKTIKSHPYFYIRIVNRKISGNGLSIESLGYDAGYVLKRDRPIRDRNEYFRAYKKRHRGRACDIPVA